MERVAVVDQLVRPARTNGRLVTLLVPHAPFTVRHRDLVLPNVAVCQLTIDIQKTTKHLIALVSAVSLMSFLDF